MEIKQEQLLRLLEDHFHYPQEEMIWIIKHIQPDWFTFAQTDNEIIQQVGREYALWRGLGTAIFNYVQWEKNA